jgi:cell division septal protein FtsQ
MWWGKKTLRTSKLARRRRRWFFIRMGLLVASVFAVGSGMVYGLNRDEVRIDTIVIEEDSASLVKELEEFIEEKISGRYFYLVPRSNIFLYPKEAIKADALSAFKRIKTIDIELLDLNTVEVEVALRKPHALWCGTSVSGTASESCHFLDDTGLVFAQAPTFTGGDVYFRYYGVLQDETVIGARFLSPDVFRNIDLLIQALEEAGVKTRQLAVLREDYELYLPEGAKVIFTHDQDLSLILGNLLTVVRSGQIEFEGLDYIDLRFGNKVYYRYRGSDVEEVGEVE